MNRINLFSKEWCELVFAGRNKKYGAYRIRMESTRRHIKAMVVVFLAVGLMILANTFLVKGADQNSTLVTVVDGTIDLKEFYKEADDTPEPIVIEVPPVPIVESIRFLEMIVVDDPLVREEDMGPTQAELSETKAVIASVTHEGTTDGPGVLITDIAPEIIEKPKVDEIVDYVEQMPMYPGGEEEMMAFLYKNLAYPMVDQELGTQGTVRVRFVVEKDGSIGNVEITRSLSATCDKEAIRVVKKMKDWIPGKQNGVPVRVYYNLPVRFKLSN